MASNMKQTSQGSSEGKPRVILPYVILLGIPLMIIMFNFDTISKWAHNSARDIYYTFNPEAKKEAEEKWEKWRANNTRYILLEPHSSEARVAYATYSYEDPETQASIDRKYDLEKMDPERRKETEKLMKCAAEAWDERGIMTYIEASGIDKAAYQKRLGELHMSDAVKNYLLNGSSSGLSIMDMSYDQLQELRKGMNLLNEIENYAKAENACQEYYQRKGRERAYNKKEVV